MAVNKAVTKTKKKNETKVLGFFNWSLETKKGTMRCKRGLSITDSIDWPVDTNEKLLIDAAKKNGGTLEVTMKVRIVACDGGASKFSIADLL